MTARLNKLGEGALRKFALDDGEGPYSVYNFEGQDWKGKQTEVGDFLIIIDALVR